MQLYELTEVEFVLFLMHHPLKTFFQTPEISKLKEKTGWKTYYLGFKQNEKIICASMILCKKTFMGKKTFYAPRGFLIDFENTNLVEEFTKQVKQFIKKHNGYILIMDPYYELYSRDIDGQKTSDLDHSNTISFLKQIGFKQTRSTQAKWMFVLDIEGKTIEDLKKNFRQNTRNIINKTLKSNIIMRELTKDELPIFKTLTEETSIRKGFPDKPLSYYQDMYQLWKPKNQIQFIVAELDVPNYLLSLQTELELLKTKMNQLSDNKKNDGKKKELQISIESILKKIEEAKQIKKEHGDIVVLSGGMFILFGDEVIYLYSGNDKRYMHFNAQYKIQYEMICFATENHYKRYNFYGITGNFDKNDKDYGMYEFKKGFGGHVVELIGGFELPITYHYFIHKFLSNLKRRNKHEL